MMVPRIAMTAATTGSIGTERSLEGAAADAPPMSVMQAVAGGS